MWLLQLDTFISKLKDSLYTLLFSESTGVKGNLTESETYVFGNLFLTGATIMLTVYFLVWQSYVMRADVIISSVSLGLYGLDGVLAFSTLTRFARFLSLSWFHFSKLNKSFYIQAQRLHSWQANRLLLYYLYYASPFFLFWQVSIIDRQVGKLQYLVSSTDKTLHYSHRRLAYILGSIYFDWVDLST